MTWKIIQATCFQEFPPTFYHFLYVFAIWWKYFPWNNSKKNIANDCYFIINY